MTGLLDLLAVLAPWGQSIYGLAIVVALIGALVMRVRERRRQLK